VGTFLPEADHVRRGQAIIGDYAADRVQTIADRPGNPLGAAVRRIAGGAVAVRAPPFGEHAFNRAHGFCDETLAEAEAAADWYAEKDIVASFEISPGRPVTRLLERLHARGYRQTGFHAEFIGPPSLPQAPSPGVQTRPVETAADLAAFSEAYHLGWGHAGFRVPLEPWLGVPGWRLYLGLCDGAPAGAAVLSLSGKDAYLADGAVDPRFRRRGLHRALLDRRCAEASAAGAEVVFSGAEFLSASYRNMLRKGLSLLCTKSIWTRRGDSAPEAPADQ